MCFNLRIKRLKTKVFQNVYWNVFENDTNLSRQLMTNQS